MKKRRETGRRAVEEIARERELRDLRRLMEERNTYRRVRGRIRQVRYGTHI